MKENLMQGNGVMKSTEDSWKALKSLAKTGTQSKGI